MPTTHRKPQAAQHDHTSYKRQPADHVAEHASGQSTTHTSINGTGHHIGTNRRGENGPSSRESSNPPRPHTQRTRRRRGKPRKHTQTPAAAKISASAQVDKEGAGVPGHGVKVLNRLGDRIVPVLGGARCSPLRYIRNPNSPSMCLRTSVTML